MDRYGVRIQIKCISTIITTIKNSTVVSCTGKIHLIAINVNDDYNIDIKGGLCLYGGGHPLFFLSQNFKGKSNLVYALLQVFQNTHQGTYLENVLLPQF